jgi:acetyl-CoA carboxylase/biotin carboxylase 1
MTSKADVASGIRLNVGGANIAFSPDYDPTSLRTDVAGKLVKRLVPDGAKVKKGEPFAEIEVMKMFMPLKVEESGIVTWCMNEGAALAAGDLLATLQLENPENVAPVTVYKADLSVAGWGASGPVRNMSRPHLMLRQAVEKIKGGMAGYTLSKKEFAAAIKDLEYAVTDPMLPVLEIDEQLSVLSGRIPADLFNTISRMIQDFKSKYEAKSSTGVQLR